MVVKVRDLGGENPGVKTEVLSVTGSNRIVDIISSHGRLSTGIDSQL